MKRRKLANGIMVLLILVIGAAGVLTAGFIRGWFDRDTEAATWPTRWSPVPSFAGEMCM